MGRLPGDFRPVSCKPPLCNPFVHDFGVGVDVEPGDDFVLDGLLDFPIPLWAPGGGIRFPLDGALQVGTSPIVVNYGHALSPIDPLAGSQLRQMQRERLATPPPLPLKLPQLPDYERLGDRGRARLGTQWLPSIPFEQLRSRTLTRRY